jgi:FkbM family methyltransferase
MYLLKRMVAMLPPSWQNELKRVWYRRQMRSGRFISPEPEYALLPHLVRSGDWAVDIGANVGHYTARLSELVGPEGRVIAFEPVPETFALLAANLQARGLTNVTLVNCAVSDMTGTVGMTIPVFDTGLKNLYEAHIAASSNCPLHVLAICLDDFHLSHRISLIKIDAERHEAFVLRGLQSILLRDRPTLIIETSADVIRRQMNELGYVVRKLPGSPNLLFVHSHDVRLLSEVH